MEIYKFKAKIESEIFYNEDNNFGIFSFSTSDNIPNIEPNAIPQKFSMLGTLTGKTQKLINSSTYDITAKLVYKERYGYQYEIMTISSNNKEIQLEPFLHSICTENQTKTILERHPDLIQKVLNNENITHLSGIGIKSTKLIIEKIQESYLMQDILILLSPLGVSYKMIKKICGDEPNAMILKQTLFNNPYKLCRINGLGFKRVDDIALKINPDLKESEKRLKAFIHYYLSEIGNTEGHTIISLINLRIEIRNKLVECERFLEDFIKEEQKEPDLLKFIGEDIGLLHNWTKEKYIYDKIVSLIASKELIETNYVDSITETETTLGITLTEEQKEAIKSTLKSNIVIVTGAAGTGKTTIIQGIIDMYKNHSIALCSLSAKAAQRIIEITGKEAMTIHRLLKYQRSGFFYNENNKLNYDIVIIDEGSVINLYLFKSLFSALEDNTKVVIVFDYAQLPPIGAGNICTDILKFPGLIINRLTKIHRQAQLSGILTDVNKIREKICPISELTNQTTGKLQDMHYRFFTDRTEIFKFAVKSFVSAVEKYGLDKVCIIVPRKSNCLNSTHDLNVTIQDILLPNATFIQRGNIKIKVGARVIQKKNNYDLDIINGEMGYVSKIENGIIEISFGKEKVIHYNSSMYYQFELAYALTVHSYQGSQSDVVIVALDFTHYILLDNCLLYTALTRASKECLLVAEPRAFSYAIGNNKNRSRKTFLNYIINNE